MRGGERDVRGGRGWRGAEGGVWGLVSEGGGVEEWKRDSGAIVM